MKTKAWKAWFSRSKAIVRKTKWHYVEKKIRVVIL